MVSSPVRLAADSAVPLAAPAGPSRAWSLSEALTLPYGAARGLQDAPRLASTSVSARQQSSLLRALSTKFFNVVSSVARGDTGAVEREGNEVGMAGRPMPLWCLLTCLLLLTKQGILQCKVRPDLPCCTPQAAQAPGPSPQAVLLDMGHYLWSAAASLGDPMCGTTLHLMQVLAPGLAPRARLFPWPLPAAAGPGRSWEQATPGFMDAPGEPPAAACCSLDGPAVAC